MALYIDADNISYNYIPNIMNNINSNKHKLYIKKIYCDWSKSESKNCAKMINNYGLEPIQCFRTGKKQSTDIKLITDVITDVYNYKNINDIYIATSDVDFTYLCQNLKKMGKNITLFCLQESLLTNYVDNVINLKDNLKNNLKDNLKDTFKNNYNFEIKDEINEIVSLKKLKKKLVKKYNFEIDENYIIKCLDDNFHFLKKNNKIKYIININKIKDNKNFKQTEYYDRLQQLLSKKELRLLFNL